MFSILFGALASGYSSIWSVAASALAGRDATTSLTFSVLFGVFSTAKGIAAIVGPIIAGLLCHPTDVQSAYGAFGFAPMVAFVGAAMLATALGSIGCELIRRRTK